MMNTLRFYKTEEHPCSYLTEQRATTAFLDPQQSIDSYSYAHLSSLGFRRSGTLVYKPSCANHQACIPIRIPVDRFKAHRKQRRTWRNNQDLTVDIADTIDTPEHYQLYARYINERHSDGDMYPPSEKQYQDFLTTAWPGVQYLEFRKNSRLLAVSIIDIMHNGISAVYTYYEPTAAQRALGNYVIIYLIEQTKAMQLPAVYLGYWIEASRKMAYKASYKPYEILQNNQWVLVE